MAARGGRRMAKKVKVGVVLYKDVEEDGTTWYIAVEPMSGAQVQAETPEEAIERIKEEIVKMGDAWCESELREAIDARIVEIELPE
jgi:predicted RNase H-like HicB family nuclease